MDIDKQLMVLIKDLKCEGCGEDDRKYFIELINYDGTLSSVCGICNGIYKRTPPTPTPSPIHKKITTKKITTKSITNNIFNDMMKPHNNKKN